MPLVSKPSAFACRAERLAWAGSGPDGSVVGPAGVAQSVAPDADAGEEMALREASKISGRNILDTPCVNDTGGYVALLYKFAQPLGRELVEFVVVGGHEKMSVGF